jgi:hypothetical protein
MFVAVGVLALIEFKSKEQQQKYLLILLIICPALFTAAFIKVYNV